MDRKQLLANLLKETEFAKFAQELIEQSPEGDPSKGEELAEKVFEKFLNELDFESIG